jgi:starch phosphorylase
MEHDNDPALDAAEANALYNLLEQEIVPEFYNRDERGIPKAWVARIRESMAILTPRFSANRTVREYTEQYYLPAAEYYLERASSKDADVKKFINWQHTLEQNWTAIRFGEIKFETKGQKHVFEVKVYLNQINPDTVRVELYADGINGSSPVKQEMKLISKAADIASSCLYSAQMPASRSAADYTARVIPHYVGISIPLEASQILWQR